MIKHILKDGTEVGTVAGIVIDADEYPTIKEVIRKIERNNYELRRIKESK